MPTGDERLNHIIAKHVKESMRVFFDTNVILDIPLGREVARSSQQLLELSGSPPHSLFMSWHTLSMLSYILAKARDDEAARAFLSDLLDHVEIGPASTEMAQRALVIELQDFEDAMQVVVAESVAADVIVSRNLADCSRSPVPATDPETCLMRFAR